MSRDVNRTFRRTAWVAVPLVECVPLASLAGVPVPWWVLVAVEIAVGVVAVIGLGLWLLAWQRARASGHPARAACAAAFEETVPALVVTMVRLECRLWLSLALWLSGRRRGVRPGDRAFSHHRLVLPVVWGFIGVSAVELVVFELVIPWDGVRLAVLVLDVYGLVLAFGALAAITVHPHVVTAEILLVRTGFRYELSVPLGRVEAVHATRKFHEGKRIALDRSALRVAVNGETTVRIVLDEAMEVPLPRGGRGTATEILVHADDARDLARALREATEGARTAEAR